MTSVLQFYVKTCSHPTRSVMQMKMMWKSWKVFPRRTANVSSRGNTFVQLYGSMEEPGMLPLLSGQLQPKFSRNFSSFSTGYGCRVPGGKKVNFQHGTRAFFGKKSESETPGSRGSEGRVITARAAATGQGDPDGDSLRETRVSPPLPASSLR